MKFNPPLLALAVGAFGIGVTEFSPMGMLPAIAGNLHVSIPRAGLLVSAYALGVMIGAPLMTLTTGRIGRRTLLICLMGIFTLGNFLSAIAGDYWILLGARLLTSLNHGAFFGVGSVVAASLVPAEKRASAVAAMFTGLTIATIGGVPLANWAADAFGWRTTFWAITVVGLVAMGSLRLALPDLPAERGADMRVELRALRRRPVLLALMLTVIGFSAMFTVFTYIAPLLTAQTHGSPLFITGVLILFGVGLTAGNWIGGRFADRSLDGTLIVSLAGLTVALVLLAASMQWWASTAILFFLIGLASFATVPPLQMRVMNAAADAPNVASAMNIGAFNLGNAIGAALGGGVIAAGLGYPAVALAGAGASAIGLGAVLLAANVRRPQANDSFAIPTVEL
jgi:DHA1 family inner membrane transport protein